MELLQVETVVSLVEQERYKDEPSFMEHMRSNAARNLAETTLRDAATYRRIDPSDGDPMPVVRHRWLVGIETKESERNARERQIDEARRSGLREAAAHLRKQATNYDDPRVGGHCKHVLKFQLEEMARALDKIANEKPSSQHE